MALAEFWIEVRDRNPLFQYGVSPPDWSRIRAAELDSELMLKDGWTTFGTLKGYDEKDFEFLTESERDRLTALVTQFNALAPALKKASYSTTPNQDKKQLAELTVQTRPLILDIVLLLEQDRYFSPDGLRYGKLVERELGSTLPERTFELRFLVGNDWSGDRSLWVWVMLPLNIDTDEGERDFVQALSDLRQPISDACRSAVPELFAYISFRTTETPRVPDEELEGQTVGGAA